MQTITRKQYPSLDIMKFLMALLIMLSHTQSEYALDGSTLLHYLLATSNLGVPFFFACSGFLFFSKIEQIGKDEQNAYYKKWSLRIGKMYLCWSTIYFIFVLYNWITKGATGNDILSYIHKCLVSSTYPTIWFLPALWIGVTIAYFLYRKKVAINYIIILSMFLYAICSLGDSYSNVICSNNYIKEVWQWYVNTFMTFRNGLFEGFSFVSIGLILAVKDRKEMLSFNLCMSLLFCILYMGESFLIKTQNLSPNTHSGYLLLPATFFVMRFLLDLRLPSRPIVLELRNLSMIIFLSQRLFLTAIMSVSPTYASFVDKLDPYTTILFLDGLIMVFSLSMNYLSKRFSFLKLLF